MKTRTKALIGGTVILLVLLVGVFLFLRYQVRKSFPQTSGTLAFAGLHTQVEIRRDGFGVPRIAAADDHDLMFALGVVHAQDRLWQMDLERRAAQGRLSEVFGVETVPFDKMFRTIGIARVAQRLEEHLSPASRERLAWYAEGVNAVLSSSRGKLPVEFDLLRYEPEPWAPVHSLMQARMIAWELNLAWWSDIVLGEIADRVGLQMAEEAFPGYPEEVPVQVNEKEWHKQFALGTGLVRTAKSYAARFGRAGFSGGSNAWAIAPSRSRTGGAVLANDAHLLLSLPSKWYEVELRAPGTNVRGMSFPGIPGVVVGRNDSIAWGVTNLMADDADFYVEQLDSASGLSAVFEGASYPLEVREEEIDVRGDTTVTVRVRSSRHGPIVSDIVVPLQKVHPRHAMSMRWTGFEVDDPIEAFTMINRAGNWKEFNAGVDRFSGPGQNFVYADAAGNIGYRAGLRLPVRGPATGSLPLPGWSREAEWRGFVAPERLPRLFNPPEGYVASANNKLVDDSYPYHIGDLWEPPARILRLRSILGKEGASFTIADFERMQLDMVSLHAMELAPLILQALRDSTLAIEDRQRLLAYFRNWNYAFSADDIATSVYHQFLVRLLENTFKDELGEDVYHDYVQIVNIPLRVITRLVKEGTSPWFDDIRTDTVETRDAIIRRSLQEAAAAMRGRLGTNTERWRWGELHRVVLRHPFALRPPLDKIFSLGPYPAGGASTALVSHEYSLTEPFDVTVGPSYRQVFDLGPAQEHHAVLAGGQSGQVFHPHFDDQVNLWLHGGMRTVNPREPGRADDILILEPLH